MLLLLLDRQQLQRPAALPWRSDVYGMLADVVVLQVDRKSQFCNSIQKNDCNTAFDKPALFPQRYMSTVTVSQQHCLAEAYCKQLICCSTPGSILLQCPVHVLI